MRVAALFVDSKGAYAGLPNVELWDESRDARLYAGPFPVVAHPPCSRWCRLAGLVEKRWGYRKGDDGAACGGPRERLKRSKCNSCSAAGGWSQNRLFVARLRKPGEDPDRNARPLLKRLAELHGLNSDEDLADALGVSVGEVSALMAGTHCICRGELAILRDRVSEISKGERT